MYNNDLPYASNVVQISDTNIIAYSAFLEYRNVHLKYIVRNRLVIPILFIALPKQ